MVPAALFGWLISKGISIETLRFCLLEANRADFEFGRILRSLALGAIVLWLAWRMRSRSVPGIAVALFLSAAIYTVALIGFSPELRKQTLLPVYPIFILFAWRYGADLLRQRAPRNG